MVERNGTDSSMPLLHELYKRGAYDAPDSSDTAPEYAGNTCNDEGGGQGHPEDVSSRIMQLEQQFPHHARLLWLLLRPIAYVVAPALLSVTGLWARFCFGTIENSQTEDVTEPGGWTVRAVSCLLFRAPLSTMSLSIAFLCWMNVAFWWMS